MLAKRIVESSDFIRVFSSNKNLYIRSKFVSLLDSEPRAVVVSQGAMTAQSAPCRQLLITRSFSSKGEREREREREGERDWDGSWEGRGRGSWEGGEGTEGGGDFNAGHVLS